MATSAAAYLKTGRRVDHYVLLEPSAKRLRAVVGGEVIADTLHARLLLESGQMPVYYFPREDVRMAQLLQSDHHSVCPHKGEALYWSIHADGQALDNGAWSYSEPTQQLSELKGYIAFDWLRLDHRFEEDEEVFGHPRDPYHRVDVRESRREVSVIVRGEVIAQSRRALFVFETGLPVRYYLPRQDVHTDRLEASSTTSICPYKGQATYWSIRSGNAVINDVAWSYPDPLPECPRIKQHVCFYPQRVDTIEVAAT